MKALRFRFIKDKALSLGAGFPLTHALKEEGINNYKLELGSYDKPILVNSNIHFNLSHSDYFVSCVIDENPVGIDIERLCEIDSTIKGSVFTETNLLHMASHSSEDYTQ